MCRLPRRMDAVALQQRLDKLGLTAETAARRIGVTAHSIRNYLTGRRRVPRWIESWLDLYEERVTRQAQEPQR